MAKKRKGSGNKLNSILNGEWGRVKNFRKRLTSRKRRCLSKKILIEALRSLD